MNPESTNNLQEATPTTTNAKQETSSSSNSNHTIGIWFRQARQRNYFQLTQGQSLYCEPYKYNIRLSGVNPKLPEQSLYSFDLFVKHKDVEEAAQFLPLGVQLDKQLLQVRGAPIDTIEYRICFQVQSRAYADAVFFLQVKDCTDSVVLNTVDFTLCGRGTKRGMEKKKKQLLQQKEAEEEDNSEQ